MKVNQNRKYVVAFVSPLTEQLVYIKNDAQVSETCYNDTPSLPGTNIIQEAKIYSSINEAKEDVYMLRYHYRQFIKIKTGIIPFNCILLKNDSDIIKLLS